jgi:UDP-N-acetylmuramoylalanine--D-glutamate ligase
MASSAVLSPTSSRLPTPARGALVLIYGFGISGRGAAELLRAREVDVLAVDDRPLEVEARQLAAALGVELRQSADLADLPAAIEWVVISPGVPGDRPLLAEALRRGLPMLAEVELAYRYLDCPLVAITGSNGKSTTTALAAALLRGAGLDAEACGNFGKPLSACVDGRADRVLVVELSSFQLERCESLRPRAAALLNVAPDHLDRHGNLARYTAAKARIFQNQQAGDVAILNANDPALHELALPPGVRQRWFSSTAPVADGCWLDHDQIVECTPGEDPRSLFRRDDLRLIGVHNLENAMAAALLAEAIGVSSESFATSLAGFHGLDHRSQEVARIDGVRYVDDSKGTNVAATLRSLEGYPDGTVHLILGGRAKGASFEELAPAAKRKAKTVYLIGEAAPQLERALADLVPLEVAGTLERAVLLAAERSRTGETVLLSPACASFDQFANFVDRGLTFQRLVRDLEARRGDGDG